MEPVTGFNYFLFAWTSSLSRRQQTGKFSSTFLPTCRCSSVGGEQMFKSLGKMCVLLQSPKYPSSLYYCD